MSMQVIGTGTGRTGTYSLKLALNRLGFGACHHMEEVLHNMPVQLPPWIDAVNGNADWAKIYDGYASAVDWPTAGFFRELVVAYPDAKFVHTERDPERWADSFGSTIYKLLASIPETPPEMHEWLNMVVDVAAKTGFPPGMERDELVAGFVAHNNAVRECIPDDQLLIFEVKQGWAPLCEFLDVPIPDEDFPRTNDREEFWDRVHGKI
ncbi:MAG: sulfotransferase family protein [Woeseiaceae bacterium]